MVSCEFSHTFSRLTSSVCNLSGSGMIDLTMQSLIISVSCGSCSSDGVDHTRHDGGRVSYRMQLM